MNISYRGPDKTALHSFIIIKKNVELFIFCYFLTMGSDCPIQNISHLNTLYDESEKTTFKVDFGIIIGDGCLCVILAFFTHLKYTSVTVLDYSVNTNAISNARWIWFFILTAISSFVDGLNIWINLENNEDSTVPFIIGWIAHLLAIVFLAFAIKYQWKHKEQAYQIMSSQNESESTPLVNQENKMVKIKKKFFSIDDVILVLLVLISGGFFIPAVIKHCATFYWIAFGFSWFLRFIIIVMVVVIHYKLSFNGPTILIKCVLLAAVLLNTSCDIPLYIWKKCIFDQKDYIYVVTSAMPLSHFLFFLVLRAEFLRLRDITKWYIADNVERLSITSTPT